MAHVEIIIDDHHGCVATRALALDFNDRELAVLGGFTWFDPTKVIANGLQDVGRPAEHAGSRCAHLYEISTNWFSLNEIRWLDQRGMNG